MPGRLKYDDVKMAFEKRGCILLETTYKNTKTAMKYQCSCGNICYIRYDSLIKKCCFMYYM